MRIFIISLYILSVTAPPNSHENHGLEVFQQLPTFMAREIPSSGVSVLDYDFFEGGFSGRGRLTSSKNVNPASSPLVVIAHGNGFDYSQYSHLENLLANEGYVVASVNSQDDASINDRKNDLLHHLNHLYTSFHLSSNLVLIGHSRGGEAIIHTANHLLANPMYQARVRVLICLAPSYEDPFQTPDPYAADALLILYGSHDEDVTNTVGPGVKPLSPFRLFDQTYFLRPEERSQYKSMIVLHGGSHRGFSDNLDIPENGAWLDPEIQQWVTGRFVSLFLEWQLLEKQENARFFADRRRHTNEKHGIRTTLLYDTNRKLIIDDFEDREPWKNSLGGPVGISSAILAAHGTSYELEASSPHDSHCLMMGWNEVDANTEIPFIQFSIPEQNSDFQAFSHLSFKMGIVSGDHWNHRSKGQTVDVSLSDGRRSQSIRLKDIQHPPFSELEPQDQTLHEVSVCQTLRIPLSSFNRINLKKVASLKLSFPQKSEKNRLSGLLVLDDIALHY